MARFAEAIKGLPMTLDHPDKGQPFRVIGTVRDARVGAKGELLAQFDVDESPLGREAQRRISSREWMSVSIGMTGFTDKYESGFEKFRPHHVALVESPGFEGAHIILVNKGDRTYVKATQFAPKPETMSETRDVPRNLADPVTATLAAENAKLKEQLAALETKTAQEKEAARRAKVKQYVDLLETPEFQDFLKAGLGDASLKDVGGQLFDMAQEPEKYGAAIEVLARGSGTVLSTSATLKRNFDDISAKYTDLTKRVNTGATHMDNADRFNNKEAFLANFAQPASQPVEVLASGKESSETMREAFIKRTQASMRSEQAQTASHAQYIPIEKLEEMHTNYETSIKRGR